MRSVHISGSRFWLGFFLVTSAGTFLGTTTALAAPGPSRIRSRSSTTTPFISYQNGGLPGTRTTSLVQDSSSSSLIPRWDTSNVVWTFRPNKPEARIFYMTSTARAHILPKNYFNFNLATGEIRDLKTGEYFGISNGQKLVKFPIAKADSTKFTFEFIKDTSSSPSTSVGSPEKSSTSSGISFIIRHNGTAIVTPRNRPPVAFSLQTLYPLEPPATFHIRAFEPQMGALYSGDRGNTRKVLKYIKHLDATQSEKEFATKEFIQNLKNFNKLQQFQGIGIFLVATFVRDEFGIGSDTFKMLPALVQSVGNHGNMLYEVLVKQDNDYSNEDSSSDEKVDNGQFLPLQGHVAPVRHVKSGPFYPYQLEFNSETSKWKIIYKDECSLPLLMEDSSLTSYTCPKSSKLRAIAKSSTAGPMARFADNILHDDPEIHLPPPRGSGTKNDSMYEFQLSLESNLIYINLHWRRSLEYQLGYKSIVFCECPQETPKIAQFLIRPYQVNVSLSYAGQRSNILGTAYIINRYSKSKPADYAMLLEQMRQNRHLTGTTEIFDVAYQVARNFGLGSELFRSLPSLVQTIYRNASTLRLVYEETSTNSLIPMKYNFASDLHDNVFPYQFQFEPAKSTFAISYANMHQLEVTASDDVDEGEDNFVGEVIRREKSPSFQLELNEDLDTFTVKQAGKEKYFVGMRNESEDVYFKLSSAGAKAKFMVGLI